MRRSINERMPPLGERLAVFRSEHWRLISIAFVIHVAIVAGLFWAGRREIAPSLVDRDGIMESFAFDSYEYRSEAVALARILKDGGLRTWVMDSKPPHVKLLSIEFWLLGPLFGYSTLSAEPLNVFCYVSILTLVFLLGREVASRRVGLMAAGIVALWPSLFLHTTQLLKDPLFIASALVLILIVTTWLTRTYSLARGAAMAALAVVAIGLLILIRDKSALLVFGTVFPAFALLIVRQLIERRLLYGNLICSSLILIGLSVGAVTSYYRQDEDYRLKNFPAEGGQLKAVAGPGKDTPTIIYYANPALFRNKTERTLAEEPRAASATAAGKISRIREMYILTYPDSSGSTLDRDVKFQSVTDVALYLPRALEIGFCAPFPNAWINPGRRIGKAGKLLSGAETLLIYICELLTIAGIVRAPRCLSAWLLLLITGLGVTVLGLVLSNVGALYRLRYLFWILLIILAARGFAEIVTAYRANSVGLIEVAEQRRIPCASPSGHDTRQSRGEGENIPRRAFPR